MISSRGMVKSTTARLTRARRWRTMVGGRKRGCPSGGGSRPPTETIYGTSHSPVSGPKPSSRPIFTSVITEAGSRGYWRPRDSGELRRWPELRTRGVASLTPTVTPTSVEVLGRLRTLAVDPAAAANARWTSAYVHGCLFAESPLPDGFSPATSSMIVGSTVCRPNG
jgi:hypothetical protein